MNNRTFALPLILLAALGACEVHTMHEPVGAVSDERLFRSASDADAAIIGAYSAVQDYAQNHVILPEIPSRNVLGNALNRQYEQMNNLIFAPENAFFNGMWTGLYTAINRANLVLERVPAMTDPRLEDRRERILAEASFLRAFHYFNLVRLYGDVPLVTTPTTTSNLEQLRVARTPAAQVYARILEDLDFAVAHLPVSYSTVVETKGRATRTAAQALRARIHLYRGEWAQAAEWAGRAMAAHPGALPEYAALFAARNTSESIWEVQFDTQKGTGVAGIYLPGSRGGVRMLEPNPDIMQAYEPGDARRAATLDRVGTTDFVNRYTRAATRDDNMIMFRQAEMILTRAEALAESGYPNAESLALLNRIRTRARLPELRADQVPDLASFRERVYHERRLELAYEGHAWHDLVRTDRLASVLGLTRPHQRLWPVPDLELIRNPLLQQNPGY